VGVPKTRVWKIFIVELPGGYLINEDNISMNGGNVELICAEIIFLLTNYKII
jgi:hypothetical protein